MDKTLTVQTVEIGLSALVAALSQVEFEYDDATDVLYFRRRNAHPAGISHHLDDGLYVKYAPETHDVIGGHIEDFLDSYLPHHPAFRDAWKAFQSRQQTAALLAELRRVLQAHAGKTLWEATLGLHLELM